MSSGNYPQQRGTTLSRVTLLPRDPLIASNVSSCGDTETSLWDNIEGAIWSPELCVESADVLAVTVMWEGFSAQSCHSPCFQVDLLRVFPNDILTCHFLSKNLILVSTIRDRYPGDQWILEAFTLYLQYSAQCLAQNRWSFVEWKWWIWSKG